MSVEDTAVNLIRHHTEQAIAAAHRISKISATPDLEDSLKVSDTHAELNGHVWQLHQIINHANPVSAAVSGGAYCETSGLGQLYSTIVLQWQCLLYRLPADFTDENWQLFFQLVETHKSNDRHQADKISARLTQKYSKLSKQVWLNRSAVYADHVLPRWDQWVSRFTLADYTMPRI